MIARGYGLVDPAAPGELRRRPAFRAFQVLLRELEGCRLEEVLTTSPPARLYRFRAPEGSDRLVGWSTAGPAEVPLPRPVTQARGRDGQNLSVAGAAKVTLTSSPCYLRLEP
jgi:hypothetical protein